jgi:small-conductance mechanosensitive channel
MVQRSIDEVESVLRYPLFPMGDQELTLGLLIWLTILVLVLLVFTRLLKRWVIVRLLRRSQTDLGVRQGTATLIGYVILVIGFMIILQTAGIDLTTLHVVAGALGIGVGFGLQNIVQNFISGIIILFERPIKVGDRIEFTDSGINGSVTEIRARSTVVVTNDNVSIIVPNSKFVTESVINWSYGEQTIRFRNSVSVAYGSDPRLVERALLEAAASLDDVLEMPATTVRFLSFGNNGLEFELLAWTRTLLHRRGSFQSNLNYAIHERLDHYGISVPFPQRDLHVRGGRMEVAIVGGSSDDRVNDAMT